MENSVNRTELIKKRISESLEVQERILKDPALVAQIEIAAAEIREAISDGGRIYFCGNGGSACDAMHLVGELQGRFQKDRKALPAFSLNSEIAAMTSISNDYGYDQVFSRVMEGIMRPGDVLVGISTSGNSKNVMNAIVEANRIGGRTIALLGRDGGRIADQADISLVIPNNITARIQEAHILIGHIICELVEE